MALREGTFGGPCEEIKTKNKITGKKKLQELLHQGGPAKSIHLKKQFPSLTTVSPKERREEK